MENIKENTNIENEKTEEKEYRVLKMVQGLDEDDQPKARASLSIMKFLGGDADNKLNYRTAAERAITQGEVKLSAGKGTIMLDFVFKSDTTPEMLSVWKVLSAYGEDMMNDPSCTEYFFLNIIPTEAADECYVSFVNPKYWLLMPSNINIKKLDTIRLVFDEDDVDIYDFTEKDKEEIKNRQAVNIGLVNQYNNVE